MLQKNTFYITVPIFYPNANLHLGHAYTTTLADVLARYSRLAGKETYFLTGSDENAEKVAKAAKKATKETKEYLDEISENFKRLFADLDISYDQFIRTSDEKAHWPGAVEFWKKLASAGDIEKRSYEGLYCVGHEAFVMEKDLIDGKCPDHNEEPQVVKEENYFFKLSKYTLKIKEKIESGELKIIPETRRNEIVALLERGLEDVSFSRPSDKVSVGIPVPDDPSQKMYVWCDALVNYVSALGFGREDRALYDKFWPADVHVIGKDILRFHAAIWPGMLLSVGLPLPRAILVHGFITSGGKKMSKTLGNVIDPKTLIDEYGAEAVRYYLARHISPFEDGDITLEKFKEAYNADLANGIGNLVSRVMKMAEQYNPNTANEYADTANKYKFPKEYIKAMDEYNIKKVADIVWEHISKTDQKIQETEPFKLVKSEPEKAKRIIAELVVGVYEIAEMLSPILPETSEKIKDLVRSNKSPAEPLFPRK
ncbi:MAG: methionine--tRNA ligase [bacterium]|nr:methionine--tRNA ligase [bacterium]